jgi:hypothetical protein
MSKAREGPAKGGESSEAPLPLGPMTQPPRKAATPTTAICAACGATVTGRFCAHCGAAAEAGACAACHAVLSPGARFCHQCGAPVRGAPARGNRERLAWSVAGIAVLAAGLVFLWRAGSFRQAAAPEMGNAGNAGVAPGLSTRAPDISAMSPEQRFTALFERVVRASESGDTLTVQQFSPMALGAYALLESPNADTRFHAALIDLAIGDFRSAGALADTILAQTPGHLFGYLIRGEAADRQNQSAALTQSYRDFLAHYEAELRTGRPEYADHRMILDDFKTRAQASLPR